jgi:MFS family permease
MMEEPSRISLAGIFVWFLGILFFFYEFFLRIVLGTIADEFMRDLQLTIREFSLVTAAYYLIYGLMQLPVGILTEKMGTRIILSSACFICTVGVWIMSAAQGFYSALLSRVLIGFGSSFAFVALLIISLNWFPRKYFGVMCGLSLFLGAIGPLLAGAPLAHLYEWMGGNWQLILYWIGMFGFVLTVFLALFMRNPGAGSQDRIIFIKPQEPLRQSLTELVKNPQAWYVILCTSTLYCPMALLAAYFGTTYLQEEGFEKTTASLIVSMIWIGFAFGSPIIGKLSDHFKRRIPFLYICSLIGLIASASILYLPIDHFWVLTTLFILLGFASSAQGVAFAVMVEHTPQKLHSAALGLNNSGVMLCGAIFPTIAGVIIQSSQRISGHAIPSTGEFVAGLSVIPVLYAVSALTSFFLIRETFCRQQHEVHKLQPLHKASDLI